MKNADIHDGLSNADLRTLLAKALRAGIGLTPQYIIQRQIAKLQEELELRKRFDGFHQVMESLGYSEFDISDSIEDYSSQTYFSFIGTEEEYKTLLKKMEEK